MDLRTGASVRRFESVEIGAVTVIVVASVVQGFFLYRLVPVLAFLYASSGEEWSLPLRVFNRLCNWSLILVPVVLVVWMGFQIAGRPLATGPEDDAALDRPPDPQSPWQRMTIEEVMLREAAALAAWRASVLASLPRSFRS